MKLKDLERWLERVFAAVAFAEAGEHDTARKLLEEVENGNVVTENRNEL